METPYVKDDFLSKYLTNPFNDFISSSKSSGILLFISALVAFILANSPWSGGYHHFWHQTLTVGFEGHLITKSLHHWINDGLMAIFFFVVGLELKREMLYGELKSLKQAILPIVAALGGMLVPAFIFFLFNPTGEASNGWGIPMATDIAFALGILYLFGNRIPLSLKVFLTAIAIVDDLGAVLVIAFFYTSHIDFASLITGIAFLVFLFSANTLGVRNPWFYGIFGIGGLWTAFLMSGVHATIAGVLAAFTIPASAKFSENFFSNNLNKLYSKFQTAKPNDIPLVTHEQEEILGQIKSLSKDLIPPLQRLEHTLHPFVAFLIMPIFALSNAGVTLEGNIMDLMSSVVTLGVILGLLLGKFVGIFGFSFLFIRTGWAQIPDGLKFKHLAAVGLLGAIGFTMSLFVSDLAFEDAGLLMKAKFGVLMASVIASALSVILLRILFLRKN
jgi:NhaA family Na+:H+ antiporter